MLFLHSSTSTGWEGPVCKQFCTNTSTEKRCTKNQGQKHIFKASSALFAQGLITVFLYRYWWRNISAALGKNFYLNLRDYFRGKGLDKADMFHMDQMFTHRSAFHFSLQTTRYHRQSSVGSSLQNNPARQAKNPGVEKQKCCHFRNIFGSHLIKISWYF
jgi:hypothetical protein